MSRELDHLVDMEGLEPAELERLHRVHDMLLEAGPPPELPAALERAPVHRARTRGSVVLFPSRRPALAALTFAATVAAAAFGGGYLLGHSARSGLQVVRVADMRGVQRNSLASIKVGHADQNGNWPIELSVSGLPKLKDNAYYLLILEQSGEPRYVCGTFRVGNGKTTVPFTVPYKLTKSSRWVVTSMAPGVHFPGHVVMTTT